MVRRSFVVTIFNGLKINVRECGERAAPTLILIHGLADGAFVWDDFADKLACGYRILAIDLRGHGQSDWDLRRDYSLETHVSDVRDVLARLEISKYVIVGHSLGGYIAAHILNRRPAAILGAILVDTSPLSNDQLRQSLKDKIIEDYRIYESINAYADTLIARRPLTSPRMLYQLSEASLIKRWSGDYQLRFDLNITDACNETYDDNWWWPALARFASPVLIVRGVGSAVLSQKVAEQMLRTLRDGKLAIVEKAGHSIMSDSPDKFRCAVEGFLAPLFR